MGDGFGEEEVHVMHECAVEDVLGPPGGKPPDMGKLIARKGFSGRTISVVLSKHETQLELYVLRREPFAGGQGRARESSPHQRAARQERLPL